MGVVRGSVVCAVALFAALQNSPTMAAAARGGVEAVDQKQIENADKSPGNWLSHGRTYSEQRFSPLKQIDPANVSKLGLEWTFETREGRPAEATPIVVDGVMYVSAAWGHVYALDATTGKELWHFDPKTDKSFGGWACCDVVNRGVAVWKGRVYVALTDGRLVAINAKDGTKAWDVATFDKTSAYTITGAPRIAKGLVFIGNGGGEYGVRGFISAYDAETGAMKWRFYTVPGDPSKGPDNAASDPQMAMAAKTWNGDWWKYGGGGTVWDSIVYDPEFDQLYFGVGNGSPWNHHIRSDGKGDNLFLSSIVAVKPETGQYLWHFQETPGESWDYTATQSIVLATLKVDGADRKVIMHAPKNGFFYVVDRATGKFVSGKNFVPMAKAADTPPGLPISWAYGLDANGRPLENPEARFASGSALVTPSGVGAHNWQPMSYSPQTGLAYIPARRTFMEYLWDKEFVFKSHLRNAGVYVAKRTFQYPRDAKAPGTRLPGSDPNGLQPSSELAAFASGSLLGWDPVAQKEAWSVPGSFGGTLVTASDLLFVPQGGTKLAAFGARDGKKLWEADAGMGILNPPITYEVGGVQYVVIMTSGGGGGRTVGLMPKARVLVYKLGGTGTVPPYPTPDPTPEPPVIKASVQELSRGEWLYSQSCQLCHGGEVNGGGSIPDLRRSPYIQDKDAFLSVLHGGLAENGMPNFTQWLKAEDTEVIRAYIVGQAVKLYAAENKK